MYADQEEGLVFLATRALGRFGCHVEGHTDPRDSLQALRARADAFDAVVTDLSAAGMSDFAFGAVVRELKRTLPIVMTSDYVRREDRDAARQFVMLDVILQPDTIDELGALLHRCLIGVSEG